MTQDEAIAIAKKVLAQEIELPEEDEFICTKIEETEEGWYTEFNSRIYTETEDLMYALVVAPLMIRPDGSYRFVF